MNVKKTAEGIIFHMDGDMEKSLLKCVMDAVSLEGTICAEIQARLDSSNGETFYVLRGEVPEFVTRLTDFFNGCAMKEEAPVNEERFESRDMAKCLIVSCHELAPANTAGLAGE